MKKTILVISIIAIIITSFVSCSGEIDKNIPEEDEFAMYDYGDGFTARPLAENGYHIVTVNIEIPGLDREYHYIYGSDLHIISENLDEIADEYKETVKNRIKMFTSSEYGITSAKQWETLPELLNSCCPEGVFLNADIIDFNSEANTELLKAGLSKLTVPFYYMRADHDSKPSYLSDADKTKAADRQNNLCANDEFFQLEYDKFIVLCVNNSLTNADGKKLSALNAVFEKGKPVIVVSHVPYDSTVDTSLSEKIWDREKTNCTLGKKTTYTYFSTAMFRFIDTVVAEDSPVTYILAGHTHFDWQGNVNENIQEHVFSTLADYNIGVINIVPSLT